MAIANKAFVWALFAAGGTVTALLFPVLIALFLLVSAGHVPAGLEFGPMQAFAAGWPGRIALFAVITLSLWHAAHRLRVLVHDVGVRADRAVAVCVYALALAGTAWTLVLLLRIGPA